MSVFVRGFVAVVIGGCFAAIMGCSGEDRANDATVIQYDARSLSVGEVCDGVSMIVCERDEDCFDPRNYPDPCDISWRNSCCQSDGNCEQFTKTTQDELEVCIADLTTVTCAELMQSGLPDSCSMLAVPR